MNPQQVISASRLPTVVQNVSMASQPRIGQNVGYTDTFSATGTPIYG